MITYNTVVYNSATSAYREGVCLSGDTKPINADMQNGSKLLEMDTATLYVYDAENQTWRAWE